MSTSRKASSGAAASWLADGGALFDLGLADEGVKSVEATMQIGPYRLIEKLGEGGLGVVWRAEQISPIQREVAIKLTKPELHYRSEVITRFELERQALARMNHPNIAAILDAGTLPDERPFFVMELVRGLPLTSYCTKRKLGVRARLELFITICNAVHHAHQKGILHRDLKPSNILVTEQDGAAVPKVIDFGIAKALDETDPALSGLFFKTQLGDLPCATYQYMSPEQASLGATDVDTRSDIYTLGVILYELLTGKLPLPEAVARGGGFEEIATWVRGGEAVRPSVELSKTQKGPVTPIDGPFRPFTTIASDLDWITMRALEKDRERRYDSAAALAEDLQKHLAHEPVSAGPPTALYRCGKWVRRHRVAFAAITAVALSLCIGFVSTWMALQREKAALGVASEQRLLAEKREREAVAARDAETKALGIANASRLVADTARGRAEQLINDMLYDLRDKLEPVGKVPLLEQVSLSAQQYFDSVPPSEDNDVQQRNRAAMLQNRGSILLVKGEATEAMQSFVRSLEIVKARATALPNNVQRLHDLALAHERVGSAHEALRNDGAAAKSYHEMLRAFEHLQASAPNDVGTWRQDLAVAHERVGDLARKLGDSAKAAASYQLGAESLRALPMNEVVLRRLLLVTKKLAITLEAAGKNDAALAAYRQEIELTEKMPNSRREQAAAHLRLAALLFRMNAETEAKEQANTTMKLLEGFEDDEATAWRATAGEIAR